MSRRKLNPGLFPAINLPMELLQDPHELWPQCAGTQHRHRIGQPRRSHATYRILPLPLRQLDRFSYIPDCRLQFQNGAKVLFHPTDEPTQHPGCYQQGHDPCSVFKLQVSAPEPMECGPIELNWWKAAFRGRALDQVSIRIPLRCYTPSSIWDTWTVFKAFCFQFTSLDWDF